MLRVGDAVRVQTTQDSLDRRHHGRTGILVGYLPVRAWPRTRGFARVLMHDGEHLLYPDNVVSVYDREFIP